MKYDFRHRSDASRKANEDRVMSILRRSQSRVLNAAAVVVLAAGLAACQEATSKSAPPPRPVQVAEVAFENRNPTREFVGVVRARYETDLAFRVGGKVIARKVNVGDVVKAGDVLAQLDPQDLRLQREQAEAEIIAARSALAQTTSDEARYASLAGRGYAAVAEHERKKAARDEAEGRVQKAIRALDLARNQLQYADLVAEADGVVTASLVEPGQVVSAGQTVLRVARLDEKEAVVALPETWLAEARRADATVRLWSEPDRAFRARLRELSPQADATTRTYAARFTIEDADATVALGMTATVSLARPGEGPVARLPLSAIFNQGKGPAVYVVNEPLGALALRPVEVEAFTEENALVKGGLNPGEKVVTLGVHKLEVGQAVRAVEAR
jgi:RND family efflux transporter MFP subunit